MQYVWMILMLLPSALSHQFKVVGPDAPVVVVSGSDVILPCSVREEFSTNMKNAVDLEVTWSRSDLKDSVVHLYKNRQDLNTSQIPSYRGRTAVFKEELKNGNTSLKLSNVRISDEGQYRCRVDSTEWYAEVSIHLSVEELVPNPWKTVGITIGVLLLVGIPAGFVIYKRRRRQQEIKRVRSLLNSDRYGRLLHQNLSPRQWEYVEFTLLNSEEDLKEFNLRKFDPSDRGVQMLKKVIASSTTALLEDCNLKEKSCEVLASVLESENSLTELDLSLNRLEDSGVKELCKGLKHPNCKLQNLSLEDCDLTEESCADLASVLNSENCKLIELNLSKNRRLKDSGVEKLCEGLKNENCKLQILRLTECGITDVGCADLASALQLNRSSPLKELDLRDNPTNKSKQTLFSKLQATFPDLNVIM